MTGNPLQSPQTSSYALVGTIFDSHAGALVHNQAVHIRDNQIVAVCAPGDLPHDLPQISLESQTLLPGLIDVHVHSEDWHAPLYLAKGQTSVRDVGCEINSVLRRRELWNQHGSRAPRLVCTGPLLDNPGNTWPYASQYFNTPAEAQYQVDELVERGVDQIKSYAFIDYPCFKALVDRAHHHGKFVVAHLGKHVNARQAIEAGLDEFEHLSGVGEALWEERNAQGTSWEFFRLWSSVDMDRANRMIDLILEHRTWVAITRLVWVRLAATWDKGLLDNPQMPYVPGPLLKWWETFAPSNPVGRFPKNMKIPTRMDRSQQAAGMSLFTSELLRRDYDRVLIGTDTPCPYLLPGFSYHDEITTLVECGMSEKTMLQAATLWGARALEIDDKVGSIQAGKLADLILVEGNPLDNYHDLEKINVVIRDGEWLDPNALLADAAEYARTAQPSSEHRMDAYY